jgi:heme/copper-type cytochrome/quinol oxidase subunit 1
MNKKILDLLGRTVPLLVFALLSGCAYFAILYEVLIRELTNGGGLIMFFFCPAIICGAALVLIKLIKQNREAEKEKNITMLFWLHIVLMIIAAIVTAAAFA